MTHRERLTTEVGDLLAMVDLLVDSRVLDPSMIEMAKQAKTDKLRQYSSIYK
jgi:hypothetical protein